MSTSFTARGKQVDHGEPSLKRLISAFQQGDGARCRQRASPRLSMLSRGGVITVPDHTVSMLPTIVAPRPRNFSAIGAKPVSNRQMTRSLRANRFGTFCAVKWLTENRSPNVDRLFAQDAARHV